jgi:hypothetical protein
MKRSKMVSKVASDIRFHSDPEATAERIVASMEGLSPGCWDPEEPELPRSLVYHASKGSQRAWIGDHHGNQVKQSPKEEKAKGHLCADGNQEPWEAKDCGCTVFAPPEPAREWPESLYWDTADPPAFPRLICWPPLRAEIDRRWKTEPLKEARMGQARGILRGAFPEITEGQYTPVSTRDQAVVDLWRILTGKEPSQGRQE